LTWRDVELREVRIFLVLADELHFGRTAERLGISQPGVSEAVRVLESRLGIKVFDWTSRRVRLTPAGEGLKQASRPRWPPWNGPWPRPASCPALSAGC
jgi:DNA-binding transcriptional LysR family regulator